MWKAVALVALALALEGAFVLHAVVAAPAAGAATRLARAPRPPSTPPLAAPGALADAR
jgi:hypothetical protein